MTDILCVMKRVVVLFLLAAVMGLAVPVSADSGNGSSVQLSSGEKKVPVVTLRDCELSGKVITVRFYAVKKADGYIVYRKTDDGEYKKHATLKDAGKTKYTDRKISKGHKYTYTVCAFVSGSHGKIINGKYDKTGVSAEYSSLEAPEISEVHAQDGGIFISWKQVKGASGYRVYRRQKGTNGFTLIKIINTRYRTFFRDRKNEPGVSYEYAVCSWNKEHGKKILSARTEYGREVKCLPEMPFITGLSREEGKTTVEWNSIKGASGYRVEKKISGTSGWKTEAELNVWTTKYTADSTGESAEYRVRSYLEKNGEKIVSDASPAVSDRKKRLAGKKILFVGDSITWGFITKSRQTPVPFPERVSQMTGAVCTNEGIPNCNFARKKLKDTNSIITRTQMGGVSYIGYDVIVFACGTNDYGHNIRIGSYKNTKAHTFCGAVNETIAEAKRQNPKARIILMTPIMRLRNNSKWCDTNGYTVKNRVRCTLEDYCDALKKLAKKNKVECFDTKTHTVFTETNAKRYLSDGLHPTPAGYTALGDSVAAYLLK